MQPSVLPPGESGLPSNGDFAAETNPPAAIWIVRVVGRNHAAVEADVCLLLRPFVNDFVIARLRWLIAEGEHKPPGIQVVDQQRQLARAQIDVGPEWPGHDLQLRGRHENQRVGYLAVDVLEQAVFDAVLMSDVIERLAPTDLMPAASTCSRE